MFAPEYFDILSVQLNFAQFYADVIFKPVDVYFYDRPECLITSLPIEVEEDILFDLLDIPSYVNLCSTSKYFKQYLDSWYLNMKRQHKVGSNIVKSWLHPRFEIYDVDTKRRSYFEQHGFPSSAMAKRFFKSIGCPSDALILRDCVAQIRGFDIEVPPEDYNYFHENLIIKDYDELRRNDEYGRSIFNIFKVTSTLGKSFGLVIVSDSKDSVMYSKGTLMTPNHCIKFYTENYCYNPTIDYNSDEEDIYDENGLEL